MSMRVDDLPETAAPSVQRAQTRVSEPTRATALVKQLGMLRDQVDILSGDVEEDHRTSFSAELRSRASVKAAFSPRQLLNQLADGQGFSWTSLARMMRVSVPAVRKWRRGESISGENRRRLAILNGFIEMLHEHFGVEDPASWMEMPLTDDVPLTGVDVYSEGQYELLLEFAGHRISPERLLDDVFPDWRSQYPPSEFEVFDGPDGQPAFSRRRDG